ECAGVLGHLRDRAFVVLDEDLFGEATILVKGVHLAIDDLLEDVLGLAFGANLVQVDLTFGRDDVGGNAGTVQRDRVGEGGVHGDVFGHFFAGFIGRALDLGQYANLAVAVDVKAVEAAFAGQNLDLAELQVLTDGEHLFGKRFGDRLAVFQLEAGNVVGVSGLGNRLGNGVNERAEVV